MVFRLLELSSCEHGLSFKKDGPEDHLGIIRVTTPTISLEHAETSRGEEWWQDYFLLDFWMRGHLVSFSRQGRSHSEPQGQGHHSDQRRWGLHLRPWRWHCFSSRPRKQNLQSKRIILELSGPVEFASPGFGLAWHHDYFILSDFSLLERECLPWACLILYYRST